jgi:hypothetical protein
MATSTTIYPGFLPRQGLGEPSPQPCDFSTGRPMRNGSTFQTRYIITGHCVFRGGFFEAQTLPQPKFASIVCGTTTTPTTKPKTVQYQQVFFGTGDPANSPNVSSEIYFDVTNPAQPVVWYWANQTWTKFIG